MDKASADGMFADYVRKVQSGEMEPYCAAHEIFASTQLLRELLLNK